MLRTGDFKLGIIHGTLKAYRQELIMQRNLFLMSNIVIKSARDEKSNRRIRIFAYEVPLGYHRDECIDLLGYDEDHFLYIIELKDSESKEKLPEAERQIGAYSDKISKVRLELEQDFAHTFFMKMEFKEMVKKVILAPNKFYEDNSAGCRPVRDITYLYFKDSDLANLQSNNFDDVKLDRPLQVHIWNFSKTK